MISFYLYSTSIKVFFSCAHTPIKILKLRRIMRGKHFYYLAIFFFLIYLDQSKGQIFSQDFNSSTVLSDYYNSNPSTNQFRIISTTGAGALVMISTNSLKMTRLTSTSNIAYAERNVDFTSIPSIMKFSFSFSVSGNTTSTTTALTIAVGGDVSNASAVPTNSNTYAKFGINFTASDGEFQIRNISGSATGDHSFTGAQTITWFLNNSGSDVSYNSPSSSTELLNNDKVDIWVGTTKEFSGINVTTATQTLARFKILANGWVDNNTILTFDDIIIENESALPVELTSFTAEWINDSILLNWSTATEINNYGFNVERKSENSGWEAIGFVKGSGNCNSPKTYSFCDLTPRAGKIQYRLKQIDNDGSYKYYYANEVEVNVDGYELKQNYPNPFNPVTHISYSLPVKSNVKLAVYDLLGREITVLVNNKSEAGIYNVEFDGSKLSSGIYYYALITNGFIQTKKLVLIK